MKKDRKMTDKPDYEKPPKPEKFESRAEILAYGRECIKAAPPEVRSEWGTHAAQYTAPARDKNKRAKEILKEILSLPAKDVGLDMPIPGMEGATIYDVILSMQTLKAAAGELKSAEFVRDTVGDAPVAEAKIETQGFDAPENKALLEKIAKRLDIKEEEE